MADDADVIDRRRRSLAQAVVVEVLVEVVQAAHEVEPIVVAVDRQLLRFVVLIEAGVAVALDRADAVVVVVDRAVHAARGGHGLERQRVVEISGNQHE
ncbi:MAG TPA: hypothetical protein VFX59_14615 [Polyangiales bacterium]|nr:hypothetical protein [Polyangiales bacterium]